MAEEKVGGYRRRSSTGGIVEVREHSRSNEDAIKHALLVPGRPPIAARSGTFPNGRALPYIFVQPTEVDIPEPPLPLPVEEEKNPAENYPERFRNLSDSLRGILEPEKKKVSKKTQKVISASANIVMSDEDIIRLSDDE